MTDFHGAIWWTELMTRDPKSAVAYYKKIAGWTFAEMPMEGTVYNLASKNGQPMAGIMDISKMPHMDDLPPHWFTYIATRDVDEAVKETQAAGGKILRPVFHVPNIGRIAIVQDPTGAALGLMTPESDPSAV